MTKTEVSSKEVLGVGGGSRAPLKIIKSVKSCIWGIEVKTKSEVR